MSDAGDAAVLRVLLLEDSSTDAALVEHSLRKAAVGLTMRCVQTRADFLAELEAPPDIVLADMSLPTFDGRSALALVRERHPEIPVIIVTGILGDEDAAEILKAGARDFVLKDRLARLAPAIRRAISEERGIRARKAAERAVRESEIRYRRLFEAARDGIVILDARSGAVVDANEAIEHMLGCTRAQLIGRPLWRADAFDNEHGERCFRERLAQDPGCSETLQLRGQDGATLDVEMSCSGYVAGNAHLIQCSFRDVSDRTRAEHALARSEERFRALIEHGSDIVVVMDRNAVVQYVSPAISVWDGGLAPEDLVGRSAFERMHPEDVADSRRLMRGLIGEPGAMVRCEQRYRRSDGGWSTFETLSRNLLDVPAVGGIVVNMRDVTERRVMEGQLHHANRALRTFSAGNAALVHATDEPQLYHEMCRVIVESGDYQMAWVGLAQDDAQRSIVIAAHAGGSAQLPPTRGLSWADAASEGSPMGKAIRLNAPQIVRDAADEPAFAPWCAAAAQDCGSVLALPLIVRERVVGALGICARETDAFDAEETRLLAELAADLSYGIASLRDRIEHEASVRRLNKSMEATIYAIAGTVELRDPYTAGHQRRVASIVVAIAAELGLGEERINGLRLAATIHDVGKVVVPAEILAKPARLTALEYEIVKQHAQAGYEILKDVAFPWPIAETIRQHHERLDGSGYPQGLRGGQIILEARILAVADVVESIASHRPYRAALGLDAAFAAIEAGRGTQFDPGVVDACLHLFRDKGYAFPA